jgi:pimeloyl-ACP methyl ester carboxylesterase
MATPTLSRHLVSGVLGDIAVDVRSAGRKTPRPAVVTVHGFKGFKDWGMWPPLADRLARAGFTAVALNMSGSGVEGSGFAFPERFGHNTFSAELEDLGRVVDALYQGQLDVATPTGLGLVGHSRGGGISILHAANDARVRALVTWSAISTVERWHQLERREWRACGVRQITNARTGEVLPLYTDVLDDIEENAAALDIRAAAERITIPWLLVHGTDDEAVNITEGKALAAAAPPSTRVMTVEGAGHTFGAAHPWNGGSRDLDRVFDATVAFLSAELTGR